MSSKWKQFNKYLCIITLIFSLFVGNHNAEIVWNDASVKLPSQMAAQVTAYDITTGLAWIFGGWSGGQIFSDVYSWNITSGIITSHGQLSIGKVYMTSGQVWTTIGTTIYFIQGRTENNISSFDMNTGAIVSNNITIPPMSEIVECMTSYLNKYLIVTGYTYTNIYDFALQQWLPNINISLNQQREGYSCQVYGDYVYVVAGRYGGSTHLNSIEKLDLTTLENWIMLSNRLTFTTYILRTTVVNDEIVVTGGYNGQDLDKVNVISTGDDSVRAETSLNHKVNRHGIITGPNNEVIIIGGRYRDATIDLIQISIDICQGCSLHNWIYASKKLPKPDSEFMCSYHSFSNSIFILGGFDDSNALLEWDLTNNNFIQHIPLNQSISPRYGQSYVTYGNYIYYVENHQLGLYDMSTRRLMYPLGSVVTFAEGQRLCLSISNDGQYVFILGGTDGHAKNRRFQIYDITNDSLITAPDMKVVRSSLACITGNNGYLYAIGGDSQAAGHQNTIERINISNISNIQSLSWQNISTMSEGKNGLRVSKINNDIYILGGDLDVNSPATEKVEVIYNTDSYNVAPDASLPIKVSSGCSVSVRQSIYYIGGSNFSLSKSDDIFWTDLVAPQPTINPTTEPTSQPSTTPPWNILYQNNENFRLSLANHVGNVPVLDNMYTFFSIYISSRPSNGPNNLLQIGDTDSSDTSFDRRPTIYITQSGNIIFRLRNVNNTDNAIDGPVLELSKWYNVTIIYTQSLWECYINNGSNNVLINRMNNFKNHNTFSSKKVWASGSFITGAYTINANISNILIQGYPYLNGQGQWTLNNWIYANNTLPHPSSQFICGYHSISNSIFMCGGTNDSKGVLQWDLTSNQFIQLERSIEAISVRVGQSYASHANYIYFLNNYTIGRYDMSINKFNYSISSSTTISSGMRCCMAISNDAQYLFITGGAETDGNNKHNKFQIYDIITDLLITGPDMKVVRSSLGCITADNGYLYAMGGDAPGFGGHDTIERIDISNISNIQTLTWQYIDTYTMSEGKNIVRASKINDNLYVLGGGDGHGSVNTVEIIRSKNNNNVNLDTSLPVPIRAGCSVTVGQSIYYIGGTDDVDKDSIFWTNLINPEPTTEPTNDPSTDPTNMPTISPTPLTKSPTKMPTSIPTYMPTISPTLFTKYPTIITKAPTQKPIISAGQVFEPTDEPTISPTKTVMKTDVETQASTGENDNNIYIQNAPFVIAVVLIVLIVISYIYSRIIKPNDFYKFVSLIIVSFHVLDVASDVLFAASVSQEKEKQIIFILSIIFIVLPLFISLYQLHTALNKTWLNCGQQIKAWVRDNVALLFILSMITGSSFTAVELCYSNLFNLSQFDIPLSKTQIGLFKTQRVYSIILFENLPQIGLQIWYITTSVGSTSEIVYTSLAFSTISIIITVISLLTQKTIINMMDYIEISFEVTEANIISKRSRCLNIMKQPQRDISGILGVNKDITDIYRPHSVPNGLLIKLNIYVSITKAIDMNAQKLLQNARNDGTLPEIFERYWELNGTPIIRKIKVKQINSKQRTQNTINIESEDINPPGEKTVLSMSQQPMNEAVQIAMSELMTNINNTGITLPPAPQVNNSIGGSVDYPKSVDKVKSYDSDSSSHHDEVTPGRTAGDQDIVGKINETKKLEGM